MTVKTPALPPLPDELDALPRRLRMPSLRRAAPEVIATAALAALGPRRGPQGATRRRGRRARPGDDLDASPRLRAAGGQDVRRLGRGRLADPEGHRARAQDP
jgi:hypothetical protein